MRPGRIVTTVVFVAALAGAGCASRTTDQTAAPGSTGPSSIASTTAPTTTAPTTKPNASSTRATAVTVTRPVTATCAVAPDRGPAGSRVSLSCRGFAASEPVDVRFGVTLLATAKATAGGEVAASIAVPSGFAGSNYPGRQDTFQAKGRQSGRTASATFTVASLAKATCAVSPTKGLAGSPVTLTCRGFAASERVDLTYQAAMLASAKATAAGEVTASFAVPDGFAGSHYPGRKDTFHAKGRQSGKAASATFTVTG